MLINEYLQQTKEETGIPGLLKVRPKVNCADGFSVSVQASEFHYSTPRTNDAVEYAEVELGFPSSEDELITEYAEDPDDLTNTLYGYVPVELVDLLIEKHGGIIY